MVEALLWGVLAGQVVTVAYVAILHRRLGWSLSWHWFGWDLWPPSGKADATDPVFDLCETNAEGLPSADTPRPRSQGGHEWH